MMSDQVSPRFCFCGDGVLRAGSFGPFCHRFPTIGAYCRSIGVVTAIRIRHLATSGLSELVDDATAVLDAGNVKCAVVLGLAHSGWVALELRRRLKSRIRGIVSLEWFAGARLKMAHSTVGCTGGPNSTHWPTIPTIRLAA